MNQTPTIGELAAALAKAQSEIQGAVKDSANPFFKSKYADLSAVWDACRSPLSKNGLCVIQTTHVTPEGGTILKTVLAHQSGDFISGEYPINPVKNDPQSLGSAVTYARRYALAAIVGVSPIDDDGETAMQRGEHGEAPPPQRAKPREEFARPIDKKSPTDAQLKRLFAIKNAAAWSEMDVKNYMNMHFKIESTRDLTWVQYDDLCKHIERHPKPGGEIGKKPDNKGVPVPGHANGKP